MIGDVMFVDRDRGTVLVLSAQEFRDLVRLTPEYQEFLREHARWSDEEIELN